MPEIFILCILAVAYSVRVLLFDGSVQPFQSTVNYVDDKSGMDGAAAYPVGLFDHIRRMFGVYRVEDTENGIQVWHTTVRMDLWRCPKCLSFWLSFFASAPFTIFYAPWYMFIVIHLSIAFCAQFLVFVQLAIEGE